MGYSARTAKTHRISLVEFDGSDNWVEIKDRLTAAEQDAVDTARIDWTAVATQDGKEARVVPKGMPTRARNKLFELAIVEWSLRAEDDDPEPMPLKRDSFEVLWGTLADWLAERISDHYKRQEIDQESLGNSNGRSTAPLAQMVLSHPSIGESTSPD